VKKTKVLGLEYVNSTKEEAVSFVFELIEKKEPVTVFTPNAEIAYNAYKDEDFRKIISSASLLLPDGAGVVLASKIIDSPLKEKIAGVDFGLEIIKKCSEKGMSLFIVGGKADVAKIATEKLGASFPGLRIAGACDGYFEKNGPENDWVIERINESGADVIFVCFGSPAQEKWVCENLYKMSGAKIICCLGGSVDVYAGNVKRAPRFFIKMNLEWLYRLIKQPKRLPRMMCLPKYIGCALMSKKTNRKITNKEV